MTGEPKDWSSIWFSDDGTQMILWSDNLTREEARRKTFDVQTHVSTDRFMVPTVWRKHYFTDLLESLRMQEKESTK